MDRPPSSSALRIQLEGEGADLGEELSLLFQISILDLVEEGRDSRLVSKLVTAWLGEDTPSPIAAGHG